MNQSTSYTIQIAILGVLVVLYFTIVAFVIDKGTLRLLASGTIFFSTAWLVSRRIGFTDGGGREMIVVAFVSAMGFLMPLSIDPPIEGSAALAAGLGLLATEGLWAVHRYPTTPEEPASLAQRLYSAIGMGMTIALGVGMLATIILVIAALAKPSDAVHVGTVWLLVIGGYILGGVVAGAIVGLLRPLVAWPLGVMLVGIVGGIIVYGAVAPAVLVIGQFEGEDPMSLREMTFVALACGVLAGPPGALAFKWSNARQIWRGR